MDNEVPVVTPQNIGTFEAQPSELAQAIEEMRNMRESYNDLAKEINEDKKAIIHEMQLAGLDIDDNASMAEVAERMREYTLLVRGNTEFVEGTYIRSLGDAIFDGLMSKELVSIETELPIAINQSWMSQQNNIELKRFKAPNATAMNSAYLNGCTSLEIWDCPISSYGSSGGPGGGHEKLRYLNVSYVWFATPPSTLEYCKASDSVFKYGYSPDNPNLRHIIVRGFGLDKSGSSLTEAMFVKTYDIRSTTQVSTNVVLSVFGKTHNMSGESWNTYSEWDDPDQPHFANDGEKVLWYFKHHFLYMDDGTPAFADMSETTAPTLTLGANLRDLVMQDDEVVAYFTNRNWIVA